MWTLIKILLAIVFPPLSVLLHRGLGLDFLLDLILTILLYLPGQVHAIWLLIARPRQPQVVLHVAPA